MATVGEGARGRPGAELVTGSAWLAEQVRRCAALAGAACEVVGPGAVGHGGDRPTGVGAPAVTGPGGGVRLELLGDDVLARTAAPPVAGARRLVVAAAPADEGVWRRALEAGAVAVLVLPGDEGRLVDELLLAADGRPADAAVVAVVGGCGGAGASTTAVALALAAAGVDRGRRPAAVLLADLDPLGPGADVLLGVEEEPGLRWPDLAGVRGTLRPDLLDGVLPHAAGVDVLAPGRPGAGPSVPPEAARAVVAAARRSHDVVVLDLPRDPSVVRAAVAGAGGGPPLLVVLPADVGAGVAAARLLAALGPGLPPVHLLVRDGAPATATPAQLGRALGSLSVRALPADGPLAARLARGAAPPHRRPVPLLRAAEEVLEDVAGLVGPPGRRRSGPPPARRARTGRGPAPAPTPAATPASGAPAPPGPGWRPGVPGRLPARAVVGTR
ncbi:septum site-determining protein Ssd [Pseudokineococcus lusitanus]|uniref:Secretion/DNA translocation related CpaE-like protein n=1 Tax=Pseudokineococcus lusitanus TaxID=763993 RepID=A0A3N1HPZ3_9ACTN|nr:septum site-determining protein Ssd [Pseudokineococcus lusitanus]ROP44571.1 secretion/DNA translocation related CpaE-like protein [Pseudokineococcus lusitanus]